MPQGIAATGFSTEQGILSLLWVTGILALLQAQQHTPSFLPSLAPSEGFEAIYRCTGDHWCLYIWGMLVCQIWHTPGSLRDNTSRHDCLKSLLCNTLPREVVDAPALAVFKAKLFKALSKLVWWKVSLAMAARVGSRWSLGSPLIFYDYISTGKKGDSGSFPVEMLKFLFSCSLLTWWLLVGHSDCRTPRFTSHLFSMSFLSYLQI